MWPVVLHLGMIQHEETPGSNERAAARRGGEEGGGYFTANLLLDSRMATAIEGLAALPDFCQARTSFASGEEAISYFASDGHSKTTTEAFV